jgi:hypothetical protein
MPKPQDPTRRPSPDFERVEWFVSFALAHRSSEHAWPHTVGQLLSLSHYELVVAAANELGHREQCPSFKALMLVVEGFPKTTPLEDIAHALRELKQ